MASVGSSVRKAIDDWSIGDIEFAMLHACNAVDGTANKVYPPDTGSNLRFTSLLRDNYHILGPMGIPGVNLEETRWPVAIKRPKASGGCPDIADVIYGIHRCTHGHGDELPNGFELLPDAAGPIRQTRFNVDIHNGRVQLSDRIVFALLAVAVLSPVNVGQVIHEGYYLAFTDKKMWINEWWGRAQDFQRLVEEENLSRTTLNFEIFR